MNKPNQPGQSSYILPAIVFSQFCCTSLWFAGNAVMDDLIIDFTLPGSALPHLTSAVQFGFITGTLLFALLTISDRFSPSRVFFICALSGALFNGLTILESNTFTSQIVFRFLTGIFLAGIYPVGMKIAADYYSKGLGKSLGFLVGALVLGTAFPHFLNLWTTNLPWRFVLLGTSVLAVTGGLIIQLFVPDGPFRSPGQKLNLSAFFNVFRNPDFRGAAFGYFGHMWELYAFWAFIPVILGTYNHLNPDVTLDISKWSFLIIGGGSLSCIAGGFISQSKGTARTAFAALLTSALCCLVSPFVFHLENAYLFLVFLIIWGLAVIMDSPLFSTLVAQNANPQVKGTALTIVNCIGFSITILSIQLVHLLTPIIGATRIYMLLIVGPILGLIALYSRRKHLS